MQGHPRALSRREGNTLVPSSPERQGAVKRENRGHTHTRKGCTPAPSFTISNGCIYHNLLTDSTAQEKGPPELQECSGSSTTAWDRPGRAGRQLPAPFHFSINFYPQGSLEHASESLPAFATRLHRVGLLLLLLRRSGGRENPQLQGLQGSAASFFSPFPMAVAQS